MVQAGTGTALVEAELRIGSAPKAQSAARALRLTSPAPIADHNLSGES